MNKDDLIKRSLDYVKGVFDEHKDKKLYYHNYEHTVYVTEQALKIMDSESDLTEDERLGIELAAIFHDVAYFKGSKGHEARSAEMAMEFLKEEGLSSTQKELITQTIEATRMGHQAKSLNERIIQDADLSHLGAENYNETTFNNLYKELNASCGDGEEFTAEAWGQICIRFMKDHQFHTDYAKTHYQDQKMENIERIKDQLSSLNEKKKNKKDKKKNKELAKQEKEKLPEKGIETMFRVTLRNHVSLSQIADGKANTLISVNAIIISIVFSAMFPKMDSNPYLIYPGLSLTIFSIGTIIISILSTIPHTTGGMISRKEVLEKKGNLLFFGNFHGMTLDEYEWGIGELMQDKDYLYKSLTRDLYFLGIVLNRKYRLLRYSYYLFVTGLVISVILFVFGLQDLT